MPNLILDEEHKYRHFNRALGQSVEGKEHYKKLMAEGGYVPYEKAQVLVAEAKKRNYKEYKHDPKLVSFLRELKSMSDSKGNLKLGSRAIEKMKEFGVSFESCIPEHLKKKQSLEGGFYGTSRT